MERCATCRHWLLPEPDERRGLCYAIDQDKDNQADTGEKALISVAAFESAALYTAPDFGCVLWTAREA